MSQGDFLSNCTADTLADAAARLIHGHLVAFPTETVYGLGADATLDIARMSDGVMLASRTLVIS
jgi:tRNA A37 threonylcarbamoyladenosine synthetase subunit TsaC/SUA5/YrdC